MEAVPGSGSRPYVQPGALKAGQKKSLSSNVRPLWLIRRKQLNKDRLPLQSVNNKSINSSFGTATPIPSSKKRRKESPLSSHVNTWGCYPPRTPLLSSNPAFLSGYLWPTPAGYPRIWGVVNTSCSYSMETQHVSTVPAARVPTTDIYQRRNTHYDRKRGQTIAQRNASPSARIRRMNNFVKSVLIEEAVRSAPRPVTVLDLGCGSGGDLSKWRFHDIVDYVGLDSSSKSISTAQSRAKKFQQSTPALTNSTTFVCGDAARTLGCRPASRSIISSQFMFHYLCDEEKTCTTALESIFSTLKPGGIFCGILPDVHRIQYLHRNNWLQGDLYSLDFGGRRPRFNAFGSHYEFTLADCIDKCPEPLVPLSFLDLVKTVGFRAVHWKNCWEHYQENKKHPLARKMGIAGLLSRPEADVVKLYRVFLFVKPDV